MPELNFIYKTVGGSHLYGLNTPESDLDYRGVYLNSTVSDIIGLTRNESSVGKTEGDDYAYYELRHFLKLLKGTNTQVVELLYNTSSLVQTDIFLQIQKNKEQFIDSERFYKSLKAYIQGEKRLASGERTGKLGGKRKEALDKYGYSPKNVVQLIRLIEAGVCFYDRGYFPVDISKYSISLAHYLLQIKTNPTAYRIQDLMVEIEGREKTLDNAFNNTEIHYSFNDDLAHKMILEAYLPLLTSKLP